MHYESTLLNRCSYVSHLTLFQICFSINKFLNLLGGFLKPLFNCVTGYRVTVEQNARNYNLLKYRRGHKRNKRKRTLEAVDC